MKRRVVLFACTLFFVMIACMATENTPRLAVPARQVSVEMLHNAPQQPEPTVRTSVCHVKTDVNNGALNLRSCAGVGCSVIAYLAENESLVILEPGKWLKVRTMAGVAGYVNSQFISCGMESKQ